MTTIACSHCGTKYKVDPTRFSSLTPKIRCKKCDKVFEADLREVAPAPAVAPAAAPVSAPAPAAAPAQAAATPTRPMPAPASAGAALTVLFAHESASIRERVVQVAHEGGLQCKAVDNGVDALVELQSGRYQVGVLDVALPRMFGFEVCEVIRRDSNLDAVKLLLIAAIYDQNRYRRPPSSLYGADGYIEKQDLDVQFVQAVRTAVQATAGAAPAPAAAAVSAPAPAVAAPAPVPAPTPAAAPAPAPVSQPAAAPAPVAAAAPAAGTAAQALAGVDPKELERARRLGRVIVSDLALYNKDVFATAQTPDEIYNALQKDIQDSREQINTKVSQVIRDAEDVLDIAIRGYIEKRNAKK